MIRGADFSLCGRYRYRLTRDWSVDNLFAHVGIGPRAAFIGLNPSTANGLEDDPTIRRCISFAKAWGCSGLVMLNLFALVSPDPAVLLTDPDPIGPETDLVLKKEFAQDLSPVVACWGAFPEAKTRAERVLTNHPERRMMCLGTNNDGSPKHPLYLKKDTELEHFHGEILRKEPT